MKKVSDLLRETREEKGLTIDEVEEVTKIKKEFIIAIEQGNFDKLPSETYALGFVKNYAKLLGLLPLKIVPMFRREYEAKNKVHIVPEFRKTQSRFNRKFLFSARGFLIFATVAIVTAFIIFQYNSLFFPPPVYVTSPKQGASLTTNVIEVSGKTDPYATVLVNGDEAYVSVQGTFRKSVYGFSGDNKISIVAKNRFGKQTKKTLNVKVE